MTPTTDNDGAEKNLRLAIAAEYAKRLAHYHDCDGRGTMAAIDEENADLILEAAQKINAASPVGQDALAAAATEAKNALERLNSLYRSEHEEPGPNPTWLANAISNLEDALASASHANPTSGGPGAGGVAEADRLASIAAAEWYPASPSHAKILAKVIRAHMEPLLVRTAAKSTPGAGGVADGDTPRTNAHTEGKIGEVWCVPREFARQLERELNEALENAVNLRKDLLATEHRHTDAVTAAKSTPPQGDAHDLLQSAAELLSGWEYCNQEQRAHAAKIYAFLKAAAQAPAPSSDAVALADLLEEVYDGSVDASPYPDGPNLDRDLRRRVRDAYAKLRAGRDGAEGKP